MAADPRLEFRNKMLSKSCTASVSSLQISPYGLFILADLSTDISARQFFIFYILVFNFNFYFKLPVISANFFETRGRTIDQDLIRAMSLYRDEKVRVQGQAVARAVFLLQGLPAADRQQEFHTARSGSGLRAVL